ncbi:Short-chain dehydrogenase anuF [Exophiala dermatitidis]
MATLLKGVGFITGAASGIGKATAFSFAKHGAKALALADMNAAAVKAVGAEIQKSYPKVQVLPLELNVTDEKAVDAAISQTASQFGRIDYAVNNAGITGVMAHSADLDPADWKKVLDVNLHGVWLCERAEVRQMLKQEPLEANTVRYGRGTIVNMSSMYGVIGPSVNTPATAYSASKHGVLGFTKPDAVAYAKQGIRINAICPGYVATPLLEEAVKSGAMDKEIERTPIGRMAVPEEIGDTITFLASPMSSFMYGAGLVVDGGFTIQ